MTELLVGTKKGLFVLRGESGEARPFDIATRAFPGDVVEFAVRDARTGRYFASVTSGFYGPRIFFTDDLKQEWQQAKGPALPNEDGSDVTVDRTWVITPAEEPGVLWAGTAPAALWRSEDDGQSWSRNEGLWNVPTRPDWNPGAGGLALHSIATWPNDPDKLAVGISAAGVWITEDRGVTWRTGYTGLIPEYVPEDERETTHALCVHNMHRAPTSPGRLFMQFHGGVYRSDDEGATWTDIAAGLPSNFGFPLVVDPADPDSAFVIPLNGAEDRVTAQQRIRVFATRDAGATWTERSTGLPHDGYLTVLRQAFCREGEGKNLGLYFGATSGEVFGSADAGETWFSAASQIAPITSVRVA